MIRESIIDFISNRDLFILKLNFQEWDIKKIVTDKSVRKY